MLSTATLTGDFDAQTVLGRFEDDHHKSRVINAMLAFITGNPHSLVHRFAFGEGRVLDGALTPPADAVGTAVQLVKPLHGWWDSNIPHITVRLFFVNKNGWAVNTLQRRSALTGGSYVPWGHIGAVHLHWNGFERLVWRWDLQQPNIPNIESGVSCCI
ncbi:hypothetical protein EJ04DRAFT_45205 [Polyplosphaeria fusca]|uniref:Uncharacterized protein n=1 Tax=Polyplosphaeria fusca TaxID=682080 RepID=A0A9P4UVY9_9PLEO|nr:hypothetical protein EJ04DRAFT_45205 [Polyplosphaeria fusca]